MLFMETFQFKKFKLLQNKEVFKAGTDGVLLGAWTGTSGILSALDIGTGTGLLALMLAQKNAAAVIDAIEIHEEACRIAVENFRESPWSERLTLVESSFRDYSENTGKEYDLIITNPPFFIESLKNPVAGKSIARHSDSLPMKEILEGSVRLLKPNGHLSLIYPCKEAVLFEDLAANHGLFCIRKLHVRPLPGRPWVRTLMEFGFAKLPCKTEEIIIENGPRHHYSNEYKQLTGDFYLYFLH